MLENPAMYSVGASPEKIYSASDILNSGRKQKKKEDSEENYKMMSRLNTRHRD